MTSIAACAVGRAQRVLVLARELAPDALPVTDRAHAKYCKSISPLLVWYWSSSQQKQVKTSTPPFQHYAGTRALLS